MMPSVPQMLIVLAIVVVIFGGKRVADILKGTAEGLGEFKKQLSDDPELPDDIKRSADELVDAVKQRDKV